MMRYLREAVTDIRHALRTLLRSPGFTAMLLLTLAVGTGGVSALLGVVHTVMYGALPFGDGDRVLRLRSYSLTAEGEERVYNMPPNVFFALREGSTTLASVVAQRGLTGAVLGESGAERVSVIGVSEGWASTLRVQPMLGRAFTPAEEAAGEDAGVALISHSLWQSRFGGRSDALGSTLSTSFGPLAVIGVMPPGFRYPYDAEIWRPWREDPANWMGRDLNVVARLRDGVTIEAARADAQRVYASLRAAAPGTAPDQGVHVATTRDDFIREHARMLRALLVAVALLGLLACANVANLLSVRLHARRRELGIRAAIGAGRPRLLRQLLVETLAVFAAGALAGLVLAHWTAPVFATLIPEGFRTQLNLPRAQIGLTVSAIMLACSALAALAFGAGNAWRAVGRNAGALLIGGRGAARGRADRRVEDALIVAQLALSVALLIGAAVLVEHFRTISGASPGYRTEDVYTLRVTLAPEQHDGAESRRVLLQNLEERLRALPAVDAVGVVSVNPLCCGNWGARIVVEGIPADPDAPLLIHHAMATPAYFETLGITPVRGRIETGSPDAATVIIDEAFAARYFPGQDPIGRRVRMASDENSWRTVSAVVPVVHREGDYTEGWYIPYHEDAAGRSAENLHIMLRARDASALDAARAEIARIDPGLAVFGQASMEQLRREVFAQDRFAATAAALFASVGLALALFGLYGLLSFSVQAQRLDTATRMALGATGQQVAWDVLRSALLRAAVGAATGAALGVVLRGALVRVVPELPALDIAAIVAVATLLGALSVVAALAPAARASATPPALTLRH